jgi:hypothetical protein
MEYPRKILKVDFLSGRMIAVDVVFGLSVVLLVIDVHMVACSAKLNGSR